MRPDAPKRNSIRLCASVVTCSLSIESLQLKIRQITPKGKSNKNEIESPTKPTENNVDEYDSLAAIKAVLTDAKNGHIVITRMYAKL